MTLRPDLVGEASDVVEEGDPAELVAVLESTRRPPLIRDIGGEDLVVTNLTWSISEVSGRPRPWPGRGTSSRKGRDRAVVGYGAARAF